MSNSNINGLITRIQRKVEDLAPSSPRLRDAFTRIGLYVTAVAKLNARRQGIIDTGRLINSIRYEFFRDGDINGIQVGSFGVPYAAAHEFGVKGAERVLRMRRAFFASRRGMPKGNYRNKRVMLKNEFKARPYLRPALAYSRVFITDTLRDALSFANRG